jgi:flagellin
MRVNTNVAAISANRNLQSTNKDVASSMQKLSSGFRINRAADDAAGLGIANKFRSDVRSLNQAASNAEQANSLLQIAEGATSNVQKMLERMKELATQSASDSVDDAGRSRIQSEFTALRSEIGRTIDTTKFQGKKLLNGSFGNTVSTSSTAFGAGNVQEIAIAGGAAGNYTLGNTDAGTLTLTNGTTTQAVAVSGSGAKSVDFSQFGISITLQGDYDNTSASQVSGNITVSTGSNGSGTFMVSSSSNYTGQDNVNLDQIDLQATTLGIDTSSLATLSGAQSALTSLDTAMGKVATALGNIGAAQNRIEYAIVNAKTTIQNFSAAESVIRDVDMAEEMTKFSKNQILSQAGTAMLAQANQSAQGVLSLLRG